MLTRFDHSGTPCDRPPCRLGDPHARDLDRVPTRDHARRRRCWEPDAHEVDHPLGREAVREHDSFGAASRQEEAIRARGGGARHLGG